MIKNENTEDVCRKVDSMINDSNKKLCDAFDGYIKAMKYCENAVANLDVEEKEDKLLSLRANAITTKAMTIVFSDLLVTTDCEEDEFVKFAVKHWKKELGIE